MSTTKGKQGRTGSDKDETSSNEQKRRQAAASLEKAGQQVKAAAGEIAAGSPSSLPPELPVLPDAPVQPDGEEWDPMMPDDEVPPALSEATPLEDEIQAASAALEQASIALDTAAGQLATATTAGELAGAEAALGDARIAVLVAGQELLEAGEALEDDLAVAEAEESLNQANAAIVVATASIFDARINLPEFDQPATAEGKGELDAELEQSILIFEGQILEARREILDTPPPKSAQSIPGIAVLGAPASPGGEPKGSGRVTQQGNMPAGAEPVPPREVAISNQIPEDIPDPQGDDIVARQLREAAIAESDPSLKQKLWKEYKSYRESL